MQRMTGLRGEERLAAANVAATLGLEVEQYDDGTQPGMHDLNIKREDGTAAALEVTAAVDAESLVLWKLVNDSEKRWIVPALRGGWMLFLQPTARAKRLHKELPSFLAELEAQNVRKVPRQRRRHEDPNSYEGRARALGIVSGSQSDTQYPGSIYLSIKLPHERSAGIVDDTGAAVPVWVRDFLLDPRRADVLSKLTRSKADERHAFILLPGFNLAPFGVVDMLWREDGAVPFSAPSYQRRSRMSG